MAIRNKPIKIYYYYNSGQLYKLSHLVSNGFESLEKALAHVEAQGLRGRYKNLQLVFVEYKEAYVSEIVHILKT